MSRAKKANKKAYRNNRKKRNEMQKLQPKGKKLELVRRFSQFSALTRYNINQLYDHEADALLNELISEGYVKKADKQIRVRKEKVNYYKLTSKGQRFIKEKGFKIYYSNSPRHDVVHATNVIEQFKDKLDYYKHEKELKESYLPSSCSRTDGAILYNNHTIYLETITRNYRKDKIAAKRNYVYTYGALDAQYVEFKE